MNNHNDPVLCYFHFMYNTWNMQMAAKVFADASCDWQYLWHKWIHYCGKYGLYGAIMMYYTEGLDSNLQNTLSTYAYKYYNGK